MTRNIIYIVPNKTYNYFSICPSSLSLTTLNFQIIPFPEPIHATIRNLILSLCLHYWKVFFFNIYIYNYKILKYRKYLNIKSIIKNNIIFFKKEIFFFTIMLLYIFLIIKYINNIKIVYLYIIKWDFLAPQTKEWKLKVIGLSNPEFTNLINNKFEGNFVTQLWNILFTNSYIICRSPCLWQNSTDTDNILNVWISIDLTYHRTTDLE